MPDICPYVGGPPLSQDIAGPGVRVSFYLQTLFLACLAARSDSLGEITGSLYTLIMTNIAMAVTAIIMGLEPNTGMSFHDAIVVFYLLYLSWVAVFFALPSCNRFSESDRASKDVKMLKLFSVVHSYTVFVFALTLLAKATSFGTTPECNKNAVVVFFRPFSALHAGRVAGWVLTVIVVVVYTLITLKDHLPSPLKRAYQRVRRIKVMRPTISETFPGPEPQIIERTPEFTRQTYGNFDTSVTPADKQSEQQVYDLPVAWDLVIELIVVAILWSLMVMNTELLITWNKFAPSGSSQPSPWQFGQVLPLFLVVLPLFNMINAFWKHRLRSLDRN